MATRKSFSVSALGAARLLALARNCGRRPTAHLETLIADAYAQSGMPTLTSAEAKALLDKRKKARDEQRESKARERSLALADKAFG